MPRKKAFEEDEYDPISAELARVAGRRPPRALVGELPTDDPLAHDGELAVDAPEAPTAPEADASERGQSGAAPAERDALVPRRPGRAARARGAEEQGLRVLEERCRALTRELSSQRAEHRGEVDALERTLARVEAASRELQDGVLHEREGRARELDALAAEHARELDALSATHEREREQLGRKIAHLEVLHSKLQRNGADAAQRLSQDVRSARIVAGAATAAAVLLTIWIVAIALSS